MRKLLFFISFFIIVFQLFADGVEFTATAPNEVEVGEQFYLRYTLNKRANPNLPNLTGLKVVGGPSISTSTSTQIYNGQMTHTSTFSYTYVIQAISEGAFTIPPASINLGGENYSSNSLSINVLAAGSKPRQQQPTQQRRQRHHDPFSDPFFNRQPAQPQALSKDDIFIRTELDRTNIYQGERITATVKIFTRIDLLGFEDLNIPGYDGFWAQDVDIPNQIQFQNTTVNGANYRMGVLRKTVLFPQRSGKLTIKGVGADVVVRQRVPGGFFFDSYQNAKMSLSSPDLTVNVKALPDNAPGYFKGAVGNFNLSSKLSNDSIRVNDAVVYSFTISGTGNIKLIDEPLIQFPKEFEVYDPQVNLNLSKGDGEVKGSKTFEYTIIPRYPGNYNIGEIRFAYFDPVSATYKTLKSEAYKLHVYKMPGDTAGDYAKIYARGDVEYIGDEDIRFIYTGDFYPTKNNGFLIEKFWFWLVSAIPFLAFIAVIILLRKRIKESANQALLRTKKANKISRKRLKKAAVYMQENNREDFFKEIMTALWGYLGDKLSIPVVSLNKENISQELLQRNVDEEIISKFIEILEECEYAHFAPSEGKEQTSKIYNDAVEIINVFEQKLK